MPIIGSRHQGNIRTLDYLVAMWEDYRNGKIDDTSDLVVYAKIYKVAPAPKRLLLPILQSSNQPIMEDAIEIRRQRKERDRKYHRPVTDINAKEQGANIETIQTCMDSIREKIGFFECLMRNAYAMDELIPRMTLESLLRYKSKEEIIAICDMICTSKTNISNQSDYVTNTKTDTGNRPTD